MKTAYRYRITDSHGIARSAYSRKYGSLKACLKAIDLLKKDMGLFLRGDDKIEILKEQSK